MRRIATFALWSGLLLCSAGHALADASAAADGFERATELITAERHSAAVDALIAIADQFPDDRLADDALFTAAQLCEEKLGAPARALDIYDRLIRTYPDSRTALASSRRAAILRRDMGPSAGGATPLARFIEITQRQTERSNAESVRLVEQLILESPDWPGVPRALMWLGHAHEAAGRLGEAKRRYLEAARAAPGSDHEFAGYRGAGRVAVSLGQFEEAARLYREMPIAGDPGRQRDFEYAMEHLDEERLRARLYLASYVALILFALGMLLSLRLGTDSWRAAGSALVRPPTEVLFMAPIAVLLFAASYKGHPEIRPAVTIICAGGMAVAWLSGAGLIAARAVSAGAHPRRWLLRPSLHIVASAAAVVAVIYIAIHRTRLIELVIATVRFGPDV